MAVLKPKSFRLKPADVKRNWYHIDATGKTLGKLAVEAAMILMGKKDPEFTPGVDSGHFLVITNAEKVAISGAKAQKKVYRYHTGWVGGLKEISYEEMQEKFPDRIVKLAIKRMLPKTKLGKAYLSRLKVYAGDDHQHGAQSPETVEIK